MNFSGYWYKQLGKVTPKVNELLAEHDQAINIALNQQDTIERLSTQLRVAQTFLRLERKRSRELITEKD